MIIVQPALHLFIDWHLGDMDREEKKLVNLFKVR